jgi:oligoribonuclease
MTGLDARTERLLEVAVIITDGQLQPVDEGVSYVIQTPRKVLDRMDEWYVRQNYLTQVCA